MAAVIAVTLMAVPAAAQAPTLEDDLRAEIARLRAALARAEALLARAEVARAGAPAGPAPTAPEPPAASPAPPPVAVAEARPPAPPPRPRPPALNTPPRLPPSRPDNYRKAPPRFDALLAARYEHYADDARNHTFFLRKAELGIKGNITRNTDFVIEYDLVRNDRNDPYRRTYIRYSGFDRLHLKAGLEKAPIGLEELLPNAQQPFVERSEVSDRFSAAEEMGVFAESVWDRFLFQGSVTNGGRRLFRDDNRNKAITARAVWAVAPRFSLGAATMQAEVGAQSLDRRRYNLEAKYGANNIQGAQGEYYRSKDGAVWSDAFYVQAYWAVPARAGWLTHVMPTVRYEYIDRDDDAAASELRLLTVGGGILFNENKAKILVNWLKDTRRNSPRRSELRAQYQVEF